MLAIGVAGAAVGVSSIGSPGASAVLTSVGTVSGGGYSATPRSGVFRDYNANGSWDAGEPGQGGIDVTAVCVSDEGASTSSVDDVYTPATTSTTAENGSYSLTGPNVRGTCRIEFQIPVAWQAFLEPGVASAGAIAPNSAGSFVQFVDSRLNPTVTTSVNNPADFTNPTTTPQIATGRQDTGDPTVGTNSAHAAAFDTVYTLSYSGTGVSGIGKASETGSIWGIAYQRSSGTVFSSAMLKRHSGMGPGGPGAIYASNPVPANNPWSTPFTDVDTDGGAVQANATRGLVNYTDPSDDDAAFAQVGKVSWGDLDISEDGTTLYAVNLMAKTVQPIDIATKTAGNALAIPTPSCVNGSSRPWGLDVSDGIIYVGVVCDASSGTAADLAAFVFAYNPESGTLPVSGLPSGLASATWSSNLVEDSTPGNGVQLSFTKGCVYGSTLGCSWNPWDDSYTDTEFNPPSQSWAAIRPQPMLTDLEIDDDGSLLMAFGDRLSAQFGYRNRRPNSTNQTANLEGVNGGDLLRAAPNASGSFVLESGGSVAKGASMGGGTITGAANSQGPGGGEVYSHENFGSSGSGHQETSLGAIAKAPGKEEYVLGIMDPLDTDSGGLGWYPTSGAARNNQIELYDTTGLNSQGFGKGNGLADIEILGSLAPVEVGNLVWNDQNANGVQDPGEPGMSGVTVDMIVGGHTYSAVTDGAGQYLFSSVARSGATTVPELDPANYRLSAADDSATVRIANAAGSSQQLNLAGLVPTEGNDATANAPQVIGSNSSDSDGVPNGTAVEVTFLLGSLGGGNDSNSASGDGVDREGFNRHIFDFGFTPRVSLGNRVWFDTNNNAALDGGEQPAIGVAVELFSDVNANGIIDVSEQTPVAYDTTDANGLYYFDQFTDASGNPLPAAHYLASGTYVIGVAKTNFGASGPLAGYHSSGTSINAAGVVSETIAPDPDNDTNADDNGTTQTTGFYAGGVLSLPVTVTPGDEPTGEEIGVFDNNDSAAISDDSSNLSIDFGFYTQSLGDLVWVDGGSGGGTSNDGLLNGTESGHDGVTVKLYAADGTTEIPVGPDGRLGTADDAAGGSLTVDGGLYRFTGLPEGSYVVKIEAPTGYVSTTDPVLGSTALGAESDDNGAGTGSGTIASGSFSLTPGSSANGSTVSNVDGSTSTTRVDFGLVELYDLTLLKTLTSSGPYSDASAVTFALTVTNNGPGSALTGLTVTDKLPTGLSFANPAATGTDWNCGAPSGQLITCAYIGATLASGDSAPPVTVNATVDTPAATGSMVNVAVVEPSPLQPGPESIPVGSTPDRFENGNNVPSGSDPSNNDSSIGVSVSAVASTTTTTTTVATSTTTTVVPVTSTSTTLAPTTTTTTTSTTLAPASTTTTVASTTVAPTTTTGVPTTTTEVPTTTSPDTATAVVTSTTEAATTTAPVASTIAPPLVVLTPSTTTVPSTTTSEVPLSATIPLIAPSTTVVAATVPEPTSEITGVVWKDANRNGQKDPDERPVAGAKVCLRKGETVVVTTADSQGSYVFDSLLPGTFVVCVQASTDPTNGPRERTVNLGANEHQTVNFGFSQVDVNGVEVERPSDLAFTGSPTAQLLALALVLLGLGGFAISWRRRSRVG